MSSTDHGGILAHSPLDAKHRALGARMVDFGGWEMPIQYVGVLEEHRACRSNAVAFDVSHLGSVRVGGPGALDALQWLLTADLSLIGPGRTQYSHCLDPDDAHVVDDVIVWWLDQNASGEYDLVVLPNASNTAPFLAALGEAANHSTGPCVIEDLTTSRALIAVQGPRSREYLATIDPGFAKVARRCVEHVSWNGADCLVGGTGYTGEDGVEIHVPTASAEALWDAILAAGVKPAGLGARDTLRLEMGYPLHGHELGEGITPLDSGLEWVVGWGKADFRGRSALEVQRSQGVHRALVGIRLTERGVPRGGCRVLSVDGTITLGEISSGNFSPTLQSGIGLGFLDASVGTGTNVAVDIRGRLVPAVVVDPPFLRR